MADEEEDQIIEVVQPECMGVGLDEVLIFDWPAFADKYQCDAVMFSNNQLFMLESASRKWIPVEPPVSKVRSLKTVKD